MKTIDLDDPKDAKKFLRGIRFQGKTIEYVQTADGKQLSIEEMSDSQLVFYSKEIWFEIFGAKEGEGGTIDLETEGMDQ